jgi:uncharacterized membrane protein (UPF0127 family)
MKIKKLKKFSEKLLGLSFRNNITPIYFETRWGIHTFFVKKTIDIVICDDNYIVRKIRRTLRPWKIFVWNPLYKNVFELPPDDKNYSHINIGDKIKIIG